MKCCFKKANIFNQLLKMSFNIADAKKVVIECGDNFVIQIQSAKHIEILKGTQKNNLQPRSAPLHKRTISKVQLPKRSYNRVKNTHKVSPKRGTKEYEARARELNDDLEKWMHDRKNEIDSYANEFKHNQKFGVPFTEESIQQRRERRFRKRARTESIESEEWDGRF